MSDGRAIFGNAHAALMAAMGTDLTVQRGSDAAVPVRAFIEVGQTEAGRYGKVAGQVYRVSFLAAEWFPKRGDIVTFDGVGHPVESIESDDGQVVQAVLHG